MDPSAFIQGYFRIRSADTVGLNTDSGWAAAENVNATIGTGIPFRIRFKVRETASGDDTNVNFKLQVNRNSGGWNDVDVNLGAATEAAGAIVSAQFNDGDAATELLTNTTTYVNGEGSEDAETEGNYGLSNEETEFEWCLLIHSFHDGPIQNVVSDTLEFRVVEDDGTVFTGTYTNPTVTVDETLGFIGGTFVESPGRVGPFADSNGNLYAIIEASVTDPAFLIIKSTNGGDTWREQDGSNRPTENDSECIDAVLDGDEIHIMHHPGGTTPTIRYHRFRVSSHATNPDTWEITDESVHVSSGQTDQACAISVRSDGTVVGFYRRTDTNQNIKYRIRSSGGTWGSENNLDTTTSVDFTGVMCALGTSDKTHIFYKDHTNGDIYHKSLTSGDSLSARELVEGDAGTVNEWAMTPAIFWDDAGAEKIMVIVQDDSDDILYSVVITDDGTPESRKQASDVAAQSHQGGSEQPTADLAVDSASDTTYLLYSRLTDGDLYRDKAVNDGGWGADVEEQDAVEIDFVRSMVFTHSSGNGGEKVLGYLYDNGANGGTGRIFYDEFVISAAAGGQPTPIRTQGVPTSHRDRPSSWN